MTFLPIQIYFKKNTNKFTAATIFLIRSLFRPSTKVLLTDIL